MQVEDALAGAGARVRHQPEAALGQPGLARKPRRSLEQSAEHWPVVGGEVLGGFDVLARDQQDVRRRLGADVAKGEDEIILVDDVGRDLTAGNPAEKAVGLDHAWDGSDG